MRKSCVAAVRHEGMERYNYGPQAMKKLKVCGYCGAGADASQSFCRECGEQLPQENLFHLYKSRHKYCEGCETVVPRVAQYCPQCGAKLK